MNIGPPPRKGLKVVSTAAIPPKASEVASGRIKLYSSDLNREIPIGTKGIIMDVAEQRVWLDLRINTIERPQSISIDIRTFSSYFDIA